MECICQVNEYLSNDYTRSYLDRGGQHILGAERIAKVVISVAELGEGFLLSYEIHAPHGEIVALNRRYSTRFGSCRTAELATLLKAKEATEMLGASAVVNAKGKLIDDRIKQLEKEEELANDVSNACVD